MPAALAGDLATLHAAVLSDPDDDLARLAFADCLDESGAGPGRAAYIRRAIAAPWNSFTDLTSAGDPFPLLGAGETPGTWGWAEADRLGPVLIDADSGLDYKEDRGFVSGVWCSPDDWKRHGPRLVREHPLRSVRLAGLEPAAFVVMNLPGYQSRTLWSWRGPDAASARGRTPAWLWRGYGALLGASRDTAEDAHAILSSACLLWAKSQAPTDDCEGR